MLPWREHPEARREYLDALTWYAGLNAEVGERFYDETNDSRNLIREWPGSAPPYRHIERTPPIRSKRVSGFPYRIVYLVQDAELVVIAYAHERRRPGYWRSRLNEV